MITHKRVLVCNQVAKLQAPNKAPTRYKLHEAKRVQREDAPTWHYILDIPFCAANRHNDYIDDRVEELCKDICYHLRFRLLLQQVWSFITECLALCIARFDHDS